MAKLNPELQKQTEEAEASSFEPLDDGVYHLRLRDVDSSRSGPKGPYWSWEFEVVDHEQYANRRLWNNTSLSKEASFKMNETYKAFGVPVDTDTDDLLGELVKAKVSQRVIQQGDRKGEMSNQINKLMPPDPEVVERVKALAEKEKEAEEIF